MLRHKMLLIMVGWWTMNQMGPYLCLIVHTYLNTSSYIKL
jgi:hypothetical protein